ncbi:RES family NAD+ phosphorylase [Chromobacterium vaccinii]|uniref:RES family NAD+ phosphorylase n=1 Tax=Chromobacterium vaccinii TaxID=1108595 RepID=UPI003261015D
MEVWPYRSLQRTKRKYGGWSSDAGRSAQSHLGRSHRALFNQDARTRYEHLSGPSRTAAPSRNPCRVRHAAPGLASEGRYDTAERPVFYGAEDVETCLHESRVTLSDYIALATFTPTRPLRLLDLADNIDDSSARTPFEQVDVFMTRLAYAGKQDYDLCRELAAEIEARGFDGFLFISYFAQAHRQKLRNIALHGRPVQSGKLQLLSVNRIRLAETNYKYSFGPHNDTSLPIEPTAIEELSARMAAGTISSQEVSAEFERLLNRRSEGPR